MKTTSTPSVDQRASSGGLAALLRSVPLGLRMLLYGIGFLALITALLPWLASWFDAVFPRWHFQLPKVVRGGGWALFAAFLAVYVAASLWLVRQGRGAYVEFDPPAEFVATGPFRWCRNPIAACVVGMLLALALALSSTGVFLLFLLSLPTAHLQVVLLEEPLLRKRFGRAYEEYAQRVPRWIPRPPRGEGE